MFIKWRGEFIIIVRGEETKIDMANQEINKCKAARQPLKEMVNQAAHLEMKRMQMEGQKEKQGAGKEGSESVVMEMGPFRKKCCDFVT